MTGSEERFSFGGIHFNIQIDRSFGPFSKMLWSMISYTEAQETVLERSG